MKSGFLFEVLDELPRILHFYVREEISMTTENYFFYSYNYAIKLITLFNLSFKGMIIREGGEGEGLFRKFLYTRFKKPRDPIVILLRHFPYEKQMKKVAP